MGSLRYFLDKQRESMTSTFLVLDDVINDYSYYDDYDSNTKGVIKKYYENGVLLDISYEQLDNQYKNDSIKDIFINNRHYKLLSIMTIQDPIQLTPCIRDNTDFTFIFKCDNESTRKTLFKKYLDIFKSQELFDDIFDSATKDFNCLVIDTVSLSDKIEDRVFYYKAKDHQNFTMVDKTETENLSRYQYCSLL